jgi:hypothetical protein
MFFLLFLGSNYVLTTKQRPWPSALHPPTTAASPCLQGDNGSCPGRHHHRTNTPPTPLLQATARGVDGGGDEPPTKGPRRTPTPAPPTMDANANARQRHQHQRQRQDNNNANARRQRQTTNTNANANATNDRGTTMERNDDNDNDKGHWRRMDDNTPPRFKCGRVFFHSFDTFPLPLHILQGRGSIFYLSCYLHARSQAPACEELYFRFRILLFNLHKLSLDRPQLVDDWL